MGVGGGVLGCGGRAPAKDAPPPCQVGPVPAGAEAWHSRSSTCLRSRSSNSRLTPRLSCSAEWSGSGINRSWYCTRPPRADQAALQWPIDPMKSLAKAWLPQLFIAAAQGCRARRRDLNMRGAPGSTLTRTRTPPASASWVRPSKSPTEPRSGCRSIMLSRDAPKRGSSHQSPGLPQGLPAQNQTRPGRAPRRCPALSGPDH